MPARLPCCRKMRTRRWYASTAPSLTASTASPCFALVACVLRVGHLITGLSSWSRYLCRSELNRTACEEPSLCYYRSQTRLGYERVQRYDGTQVDTDKGTDQETATGELCGVKDWGAWSKKVKAGTPECAESYFSVRPARSSLGENKCGFVLLLTLRLALPPAGHLVHHVAGPHLPLH
jgi:hypothetical protein